MNSNPKIIETENQKLESIADERLPLNRYVLFFSLAIFGALADLISKSVIFNRFFDPTLEFQELHWLVENYFGIQCSHNPGALFGIGPGLSWVFATISIVAIFGLLIWLFVFKAARDRWLTFAAGLICGGIIGNFYDRIGWGWRPEYHASIKTNVRDWIYFRLEGVPLFDPWPNFNIADSLLVCGAILLFIHAIFMTEPEKKSEPS